MQGFGVIEPGDSKLKDAGGGVARVAVDLGNTNPNNVPIRVFNPTLKSVRVKRKAAIGTVSPVGVCEVVQNQGDTEGNGANKLTVPSHLQDLYEASVKELPADQHAKVAK